VRWDDSPADQGQDAAGPRYNKPRLCIALWIITTGGFTFGEMVQFHYDRIPNPLDTVTVMDGKFIPADHNASL